MSSLLTQDEAVRQVSRALYRRLAPYVDARHGPDAFELRRKVLRECEWTVRRLAREPNFARPNRFLFREVRDCFPLGEQLWVRKTIDCHITVGREFLQQIDREERECAAFTRQGQPCRREPTPDSEYCPSHRHLEGIPALAR